MRTKDRIIRNIKREREKARQKIAPMERKRNAEEERDRGIISMIIFCSIL